MRACAENVAADYEHALCLIKATRTLAAFLNTSTAPPPPPSPASDIIRTKRRGWSRLTSRDHPGVSVPTDAVGACPVISETDDRSSSLIVFTAQRHASAAWASARYSQGPL